MMKSVVLFLATTFACCNWAQASLMDVMSDCCGRGTSFANLGRTCDDLETSPDIAVQDQETCMVVMKACCSNRVRPILCEKGIEHRMNVGSCRTLSNDTCFSASRECCNCCDLGISAFHQGLPCNSMTTDTPCDRAFSQCCQSAALNIDENECTVYANHNLCMEECVNLIGSYVCECREGNRLLEDNMTCVAAAGGASESTRPPPPRELTCDRAPCQHDCRQRGREYECYCRTGYELMSDGYSCTDIDECAFRDRTVCNYAERCLNTIGSFNCISDVVCRSGLRYDPERQYCIDIDECEERTDNCDEQSTCENTYASFNCIPARCSRGYYYDRTERTCKDMNECSRGTHNCQEGFRCDNLEGSFTCTRIIPCGTGYTINGVTQECVDVDECSQRSHNCQRTERCVNVRGSYRCEPCPIGYQVHNDNRCSQDIDECAERRYRCGDGTRCQNTEGSYECVSICLQGFEYNRYLRACMDIDECRRGQANCAVYEICQNLNGSFSCGCRRGFRLNNYGECVDIDECSERTSECLPNQKCYNLRGQYQCRNMCRTGFRFNPNNNYCEDIDECSEDLHHCHDNQECLNREGTYICQCPAGHQANRELGTCDDVDECRLGLCRGICENLPGSYVCSCPDGYTLMENKVTCKDDDECTVGRDTCTGNQHCFNTRGGFKCEDIICPRYYQLQSRNEIQCVKRCPLEAEDCEHTNINNTISHTFMGLPSFPFVRNPIRLLTIGLPNYRSAYGTRTQTYFNLVSGNEDSYFSITRLFPRGQPTGYLSLQKPIQGPYETTLMLEIVTEVTNPVTRQTSIIASSFLLIHIDVGQYTY